MARAGDQATGSDAERVLAQRTAAGEFADFSGTEEKPAIRAAAIKSLALQSPSCGVRIRNARVDGALDLSDITLQALAFDACDIAAPVELGNARLGRLSIRGARFSGLRARGANIDGLVDFSGASALDAQSWIDLASASIGGSIDGCDAQLHAPAPRAKENVPPWDHNYALRLSDAHIKGSVHLNGKVVAEGGICLDNAHIGGSFWARGATVVAGEGDSFHPGDAIHAHCAEIQGMLALNFKFRAQGRIWFLGARIGDRVTIGFDAELTRIGEIWDWGNRLMNQTVLVLFDQAEIGGSLHLSDFICAGAISLLHAKVGAGLSVIEGKILNRTGDGRGAAIAADYATIGGGVQIGRELLAQGKVSLAHARIGGTLDCRGVQLANGDGIALDAEWSDIAHGVLPAGLDEGRAGGLLVDGHISFAHAHLGRG